ncbi:glycoside hydrolase [Acephala macrosclerotiorum]|nr:glycoside hydrolase [Acephala macrosclerotiorum]
MRSSGLLALAGSASAVYQGFNYGATKSDGYTVRAQSDFESLFSTAKNLVGTSGFTSARLYTMIQGGTTNTPTSAIPAAIAQDTTLLLTLWASGTTFTDELAALKSAISTYGSELSGRVAGISVGSEDLYRNSPTGIAAGSTIGQEPSVIVDYISQVRSAISGTALSSVGVGHVDTWTAWVNGSNDAVINACDWIGVDAYPYFQNTETNGIDQGASLFNQAIDNTKGAVGSKPVWITETGWPVSGKTENLAVANTANAKTYWDQVGCPNFGVVNTWWYTLEDTDNSATPNPSFGIAPGTPLSTTPLFDLSCSNVTSASSSSAGSVKSTTATGSSASATGGVIASSGSGLSPSGMGGSGSNVTGSASTATATGSSSSNSTGGLSTSLKPTASATTTGVATVGSSAANVLSGSFVAAIGGLIIAAAL